MILERYLALIDVSFADLRTIILSKDSLKKINSAQEKPYLWHPNYGQWRFISGILMPDVEELAQTHDEWDGFENMYNVLESKDIRYRAFRKGACGLAHFKSWRGRKKLFGQEYTVYKGHMFCKQ